MERQDPLGKKDKRAAEGEYLDQARNDRRMPTREGG
jgi:hypothetical protein